MASNFDLGTLVRTTCTFTDATGGVQDPTAVLFSFKTPGATTVTTYTYLVDVALVRDSTGVYHVDINGSTAGIYHVRFYSTGVGQAAEEDYFVILPSEFD